MAANAQAGHRLACDSYPALVVLDTAGEDRHRHRWDAPVILLTSGGRLSEESRGDAGGWTLRLPKPFSMRALIHLARSVI